MDKPQGGDFLLGLFGILVVEGFVVMLTSAVRHQDTVAPMSVVTAVALCVLSVALKRPQIALGILTVWLIAALAFGACMLLITGSNY